MDSKKRTHQADLKQKRRQNYEKYFFEEILKLFFFCLYYLVFHGYNAAYLGHSVTEHRGWRREF